jgi:hypothetical protein
MALSSRKLLEHSFLALLDSGIDSRGQDIGVYMSGTAFDILSLSEQVKPFCLFCLFVSHFLSL